MSLMMHARHISPLEHNNPIKKKTLFLLNISFNLFIYVLFPFPFCATDDFLHGEFGGIYSLLVDMDIMQMDDLPFQP